MWLKYCDQNIVTKILWLKCRDYDFGIKILWLKGNLNLQVQIVHVSLPAIAMIQLFVVERDEGHILSYHVSKNQKKKIQCSSFKMELNKKNLVGRWSKCDGGVIFFSNMFHTNMVITSLPSYGMLDPTCRDALEYKDSWIFYYCENF